MTKEEPITVEVLHAVRSSGVDQIGISTQRMRR